MAARLADEMAGVEGLRRPSGPTALKISGRDKRRPLSSFQLLAAQEAGRLERLSRKQQEQFARERGLVIDRQSDVPALASEPLLEVGDLNVDVEDVDTAVLAGEIDIVEPG